MKINSAYYKYINICSSYLCNIALEMVENGGFSDLYKKLRKVNIFNKFNNIKSEFSVTIKKGIFRHFKKGLKNGQI